MYQSDNSESAIDAVWAAEGEFKFHPTVDAEPNVTLTMVYMNSQTKQTYGTCPVKPDLFSRETMEKFIEFLKSAEQDFGDLVFGGGEIGEFGIKADGSPQSEVGIKPKGLGGV